VPISSWDDGCRSVDDTFSSKSEVSTVFSTIDIHYDSNYEHRNDNCDCDKTLSTKSQRNPDMILGLSGNGKYQIACVTCIGPAAWISSHECMGAER